MNWEQFFISLAFEAIKLFANNSDNHDHIQNGLESTQTHLASTQQASK